MKKAIAVVAVLVVLVAVWEAHARITQGRRDASYRNRMAPYQHDLRLGMEKEEVDHYLQVHGTPCYPVYYGGTDGETCEIKIAEEPDWLFCDRWTIYVAFEFDRAKKLRDIHLRKVGTCV